MTMSPSPRYAILVSAKIDYRYQTPLEGEEFPRKDYFELARALNAPIINHERVVSKLWGGGSKTAILPAVAQAWYAYRRRHEYDCILTDSEHVGIPLSLMFKMTGVRKGHVMIAHRLSPPKKAVFFRTLRIDSHIDKIILYGSAQKNYAISRLGMAADKVEIVLHPADHHFWRPMSLRQERLIASAGLEFRDYPTLISAVRDLDAKLTIAAASPWSRRKNETSGVDMPSNVTVARHSYLELRDLYARSGFVVVPLRDTDFQAGSLVMYEAMACGRAVIASKTRGQADILQEGVTGLYVRPGNAADLRGALERLLTNPDDADRMGRSARAMVQDGLNLDEYVARVASVVRQVGEDRSVATLAR
jgi:glycosyltransferase involved in cell wall biosynthesis